MAQWDVMKITNHCKKKHCWSTSLSSVHFSCSNY